MESHRLRQQHRFTSAIVVHMKRLNDVITPQESISTIQELEPKLNLIQIQLYFDQTFMNNNADKVKKRLVKVQLTTAKYSQIMVAQQYRWFKKYQEGLKFICKKNTVRCSKLERHYGEVIQQFIISGDETCLMADADRGVKIVGDAKKR